MQTYNKHVQNLSKYIQNSAVIARWTRLAAPQDLARRLNHSGPIATSWLNTLPTDTDYSLADSHFLDALKRRLGLPLSHGACSFGAGLPCAAHVSPSDHSHPFSCNLAPTTKVHTSVKAALFRALRWLRLRVLDLDSAGGTEYFHSILQPSLRTRLPHKPDLLVLPDRSNSVPSLGSLLLDVHVPHWWSVSEATQRTACMNQTSRVCQAWQVKLSTQYQNWDGSPDSHELLSGTLSTGGAAHPDFLEWLRKVCQWAASRKAVSKRDHKALATAFLRHTLGTLSVALQAAVTDKRRACLGIASVGPAAPRAGDVRHWEVATRPRPLEPPDEDSD